MSPQVSGMTEENTLTEPAKQAVRSYMKRMAGLTEENTLTQPDSSVLKSVCDPSESR